VIVVYFRKGLKAEEAGQRASIQSTPGNLFTFILCISRAGVIETGIAPIYCDPVVALERKFTNAPVCGCFYYGSATSDMQSAMVDAAERDKNR
jgi:hypothetical protein